MSYPGGREGKTFRPGIQPLPTEHTTEASKTMTEEKPHEVALTLASPTSSTAPITASLTVTDSSGEVLHAYDMNEHDFVRLVRGGVVRVYDEMDAMRRKAGE